VGSLSDQYHPQEKCNKFEKKRIKLNHLWLNLNSNCNLTCVHCYAEGNPFNKSQYLELNYIEKVLVDAVQSYNLDYVQLIGGEPLLLERNYIAKIIDIAVQLKIPHIEIFTNGHAINDSYVEYFKSIENLSIAISIYNHQKAIHDQITGKVGSWKKTVSAINKLLNAKIKIRFGVIAMEANKDSILQTCQWLKDHFGIDTSYDVVRSCGRGNNRKIIPRELFINRHTRKEDNFLIPSHKLMEKTLFGNTCWADKICVHFNGNVTPCEMDFSSILGNIKHSTLSEILQGKEADNTLRLTKDKVEVCKDCEFRYVCWECRAMELQLGVGLNEKPITCSYNPYSGIWESTDTIEKKIFHNVSQQFQE
jgi:radical SAM protein with 4Fe4S-binding SPASM domain